PVTGPTPARPPPKLPPPVGGAATPTAILQPRGRSPSRRLFRLSRLAGALPSIPSWRVDWTATSNRTEAGDANDRDANLEGPAAGGSPGDGLRWTERRDGGADVRPRLGRPDPLAVHDRGRHSPGAGLPALHARHRARRAEQGPGAGPGGLAGRFLQ